MSFDNHLISKKLQHWEAYLKNFRLPQWDDIPDLGLYMEQVIILLKKYLSYLPPELKEEQFITAATINNYVRTKIMPKPQKKKYFREHISYLIIILTLKQSLSIALIKKLLPIDISIKNLKPLYNSYIKHHHLTCQYFSNQVMISAKHIFDKDIKYEISTDKAKDLIISSAIISGLTRLLSEKLILLDDRQQNNNIK